MYKNLISDFITSSVPNYKRTEHEWGDEVWKWKAANTSFQKNTQCITQHYWVNNEKNHLTQLDTPHNQNISLHTSESQKVHYVNKLTDFYFIF